MVNIGNLILEAPVLATDVGTDAPAPDSGAAVTDFGKLVMALIEGEPTDTQVVDVRAGQQAREEPKKQGAASNPDAQLLACLLGSSGPVQLPAQPEPAESIQGLASMVTTQPQPLKGIPADIATATPVPVMGEATVGESDTPAQVGVSDTDREAQPAGAERAKAAVRPAVDQPLGPESLGLSKADTPSPTPMGVATLEAPEIRRQPGAREPRAQADTPDRQAPSAREGLPSVAAQPVRDGLPPVVAQPVRDGLPSAAAQPVRDGLPSVAAQPVRDGLPPVAAQPVREGLPSVAASPVSSEPPRDRATVADNPSAFVAPTAKPAEQMAAGPTSGAGNAQAQPGVAPPPAFVPVQATTRVNTSTVGVGGSPSVVADIARELPGSVASVESAKSSDQGAGSDHGYFGTLLADSGSFVDNQARLSPAFAAQVEPAREIANKVINQIVHAAKPQLFEGGAAMTLRLDPPHLGVVHMNVIASEGNVTAFLRTSTESAKQVLEADVASLKQTLAQAGVKLDSINVSVMTGGSDQGWNRFANSGQPGNGAGHNNAPWGFPGGRQHDMPAIGAVEAAPRQYSHGFDYLA